MNEHVQATNSAPLFNPLAPEFIRDPYPYYERLRTTDPMHLTPLGMYVASRHAEASLVLRDKRFGKNYVERTIRRFRRMRWSISDQLKEFGHTAPRHSRND